MQKPTLNFPLERFSEDEAQSLFCCLWGWKLCSGCREHNRCRDSSCPTSRTSRLDRFVGFYREVTSFYESDQEVGCEAALRSHGDLHALISALKLKTNVVRERLFQELFQDRGAGMVWSRADQEQALDLAAQVMTMVEPFGQSHHASMSSVEAGLVPTRWTDNMTFVQYMSRSFPHREATSINKTDVSPNFDPRGALKATQIQNRLRLKFRPTSNLRDHLKFDRTSRVVEIFHHTAFVKECLRLTYDRQQEKQSSAHECWSKGTLPRQLALEVLDSIQKILFPLTDDKSRVLLESLVSTFRFDPDCLQFESATIRHPIEQDVSYRYFAGRLCDLYEELENPTPHGLLEEWLQRKSGARYIMLATLIGVLIAIVLGILSLSVSIFQAYVAYQAWKHPVFNNP